jgi:glutathione synthase/RimK-type ligase-like ATP-grasp enzyme
VARIRAVLPHPMTILIISAPGDLHGDAVKWLLDRQAIACATVIFPDLPDKARFAWTISQDREPRLAWQGIAAARHEGGFSVVWNRRSFGACVPEDAHPADREHIIHHNEIAQSALKGEFLHGALAVNSFTAQLRAQSKILQLRVARDAGMNIPETLFSNDRDEIRAFQDRLGTIIAKPLFNVFYQKGDARYQALTTQLPPADQFDSRTFAYSPNIFQPLIRKKSDIRVFVLGRNMFAVEIHSQDLDRASTDFRGAPMQHLTHRRIDLPTAVARSIDEFQKRMGLIMGQFDFILDENGNWVFLEVNEQGNWLWLEENVPGLHLTDCLIKFLIRADPDYVYAQTGSPDFLYATFKQNVDYDAFLSEKRAVHNSYRATAMTQE